MRTWRKCLISVFILFNFLCMIRDQVPLNKPFMSALYKGVDPYLSFFSIYQDWMMFAPNPAKLNNTMSAKVEFMDGSTVDYVFPHPSDLSFFDKYTYGEKFRKLIQEGIRRDENAFMWNDTARFVLRQIREENFDKIPTKVELYRHWDEIPDVKKVFRPHGSLAKKSESFKFHTLEVI